MSLPLTTSTFEDLIRGFCAMMKNYTKAHQNVKGPLENLFEFFLRVALHEKGG